MSTMSSPNLWCSALRAFVDYERANGRWETLMRYHPGNSELLIPLNYNIPSRYGLVDVDWMLRVAPVSGSQFAGWLFYRTAKFWWNVTDPRRGGLRNRLDPTSIYEEANSNAPWVANKWVNGEATLAEIFEPALELCS